MRLKKVCNIEIKEDLGSISLDNYLNLTKRAIEKENKPIFLDLGVKDENHL